MSVKTVKTLVFASVTALLLAACAGGGQQSSQPSWKNYGFDGAGAGGGTL